MTQKRLLLWVALFLTYPVAGLLGRAVGGPIDSFVAAVLAGAVAGAVIGTGQWIVLRSCDFDAKWIAATAAGLGTGLGLGQLVFGYGTSMADVALIGVASGLGIGAAQWPLLRTHARNSLLWIPTVAVFWTLAWIVTTTVGVDPADRWAIFGVSGALTFVVLSGAVLWILGVRSSTQGTGRAISSMPQVAGS
jgi:hypothetical protein